MPDSENGRNEDHLRSGWWQWMYGKLKGDIRDILAGTKKPTWKFTHFYLEIVAKMYPNTRQEEKIISRAIVAYREWSRINDLDPLNPNVVPKK